MITLLIALVLGLSQPTPPSPDPAPQACIAGWCPTPTIVDSQPYFTKPIKLKGHKGLWMCLVESKPVMKCYRVK